MLNEFLFLNIADVLFFTLYTAHLKLPGNNMTCNFIHFFICDGKNDLRLS